MEFSVIFPNHLYAVYFEDQYLNEYDKAFELLEDPDYLQEYFKSNFDLLNTNFWISNLGSINLVNLAKSVSKEALILEKHIEEIGNNTAKGLLPDFEQYFEVLGGTNYNHLREYVPHKAYGLSKPTMIRLYAIKIDHNCYLFVHGGLKLTHEIKDTPQLNKELFPKLDYVIQFLRANGIINSEDIVE